MIMVRQQRGNQDLGAEVRPAGSRDRKKKNQRKAARKARKKNR